MSQSTEQQDHTQWGSIALAFSAGLVAVFNLGKVGLALPGLRDDLGLGLVMAGWVASIFALTGIILGLTSGTIADRFGQRRPLLIGLALLALGSLAGSFAVNGPFLLCTRTIEGIGFVLVFVCSPVLVIRASAERHRKLSITLWTMCLPVATAIVLVSSPLIIDPYGWRGLWQVTGGLSMIAFLTVAAALRDAPKTPNAATSRDRSNIRLTLSRPGPWLAAIMFGIYAILQQSMSVWLPTFLIEQRGAATTIAGALAAIYALLNGTGNLTAGVLMARGVRRWHILVTAGVGTALTAIAAFSTALPDEMRFFFVLAFSWLGGFLPAAIYASSTVYAPSPAQVGTVNGLIMVGISAGQFSGPPAIAAVVAWAGNWETLVWFFVSISVIITMMSLMARSLDRKLERKAATSEP